VHRLAPAEESAVTLSVVGAFAVRRAGEPMPTAEVGSRKARALLAMLAVHGGHVPIDSLAPAIWGDSPPRDPVANLATLVSRLRANLGSHTIAGGREGYRLGDRVRVDLVQASELVDEAEGLIAKEKPARALMAARRAIHLLDRGAVLAEYPEAGWAEPARTWHLQLLRRARHTIAEAALRVGETRAAAEAAEAAVTTDAFDEVACRMLMRAHQAGGEPARALLAYQRLRTTLATELGVDPAPATRNLHLAILQDSPRFAFRNKA
jgi:DNA-binding SARP family transcriptional activator